MSSRSTARTAGGPLWRGRTLALVAIVLLALNLRTAVAVLSPIFDEIRADITLGSIGIGFLGLLPPLCFAVVGLFAPALHRRFGLEPVVIGSMLALVVGDLVRSASGSYLVLVLGSILSFAGMGVANVLLPALVKRYFPDRIGLITSLYATALAVGSTLPPLVAVPVAEAAGWRVSVGMWAAFAVFALVPLVMLATRERLARRRSDADAAAAAVAAVAAVGEPGPDGTDAGAESADGQPSRVSFARVVRSPLAWSLMLVFALTSVNAYALFAWLPEILVDIAGVTQAQAGVLLSVFTVMGLPAALIVPVVATRLHNVFPVVLVGVAAYLVGYGGLLLVPATATWLWVALVGMGPLLFPLSLVLINLRTRTHAGTVAMSSFVQGLGYGIGALGPLLLGVLHDLTGGWSAALIFLAATAVAVAFCGIVVSRPRMLEDEWHN